MDTDPTPGLGDSTLDNQVDLTPLDDLHTLGAEVYKLRYVGDTVFPELVDRVGKGVIEMATTHGRIQDTVSGAGAWRALTDLAALNEDLHEHLLITARALAAAGNALIDIADDFVRTDATVREQFEAAERRIAPHGSRRSDTGESLPPPGQRPPPPVDDDTH